MAEFPDGFDSRLIVWPEGDPTHPFPDKLLDKTSYAPAAHDPATDPDRAADELTI
jgi:hypothetical protein